MPFLSTGIVQRIEVAQARDGGQRVRIRPVCGARSALAVEGRSVIVLLPL
jgi:hypothetical protein